MRSKIFGTILGLVAVATVSCGSMPAQAECWEDVCQAGGEIASVDMDSLRESSSKNGRLYSMIARTRRAGSDVSFVCVKEYRTDYTEHCLYGRTLGLYDREKGTRDKDVPAWEKIRPGSMDHRLFVKVFIENGNKVTRGDY